MCCSSREVQSWLLQPVRVPDVEIQADVAAELKYEPRIQANEIGIVVKDGVVTLTGSVDSFSKKWAAEEAAHRVRGARNNLERKVSHGAGAAAVHPATEVHPTCGGQLTNVDQQNGRGPAAYDPSRDCAGHHAGNEDWRVGLRDDRVRDAREDTNQDPGCDG